ncbi:ATP-binding cassette domain-containing protein [Bilophila wadsworthia]|uniref:ATP-binding cassette domain-containing protein n=1 Tax=Bilophila wadsworthia TaxID=35833 RepID=UPI0026E05D20|nr:ATP-binding cassette domain-containing protein [Bilophila wadsworthia]
MEPSRRPLIEIEHVFVTYPGTERHILNDFNLTLYEGEHAVIRGGNGAGKSTLLRLLRGEQWPDQIDHRRAGQVLWHGPEGADPSPLTGRKVTSLVSAMQQERVVHQEWRVDGERLVLGGFSDAIYIAQQPTSEMCETAYQLVRLLGGVHLLKKPVTAMSQGQLRLMLVARSLVRKPEVLLLDEVTDGLDARARNTLLDALERASELSTLVMTTHRPETLPSWIGRQIVLENGKAVDGPMLETAVEPEKEPAPVASAPELKGIRGCSARIAIKDASVFIDRVPVLYDINWTINPGENWAVLGGNGAGKSTLLRLLAGDEIVAYGGEIVRELPRQGGVVDRLEVLRKGVRLVSDRQQATYTYDITGEELVFSGIDNSVGVYREPSEKELAQVTDILASLHLEFLAKRTIRSCSTGEFRRLLLARALAGEPDLLLLDEPFSGLDAPSRNEFFALLNQLARQGVQMILVTHHKADIFPAITHMLQLENGRISAIWEQG